MANDKNKPTSKPSASPSKSAAPGGSPARRQRGESLGFLAMVAGSLIAANLLGTFLFFRVDTTSNRAFSLSEGSRRVVRDLDDDLTVTAYFTPDLPPPFNATERYVRDILAEYEASGARLHVRVMHPDTPEEREEAEHAGVQMMQHQSVGSDRVSLVEGYRGIVFEYLGERQVIAALPQDTAGLEYAITTAIKQLAEEDLAIGVLSGHESPTPTKGLATLQRMMPTYTIREVDGANEIDSDLRALLVIDPQSELSAAEVEHINAYVTGGGSLGVFGGAMKVATEAAPEITAEPTGAGLNRLLDPWGVHLEENIVADARCGQVPYRTPRGGMMVPYPPAPVISFSEEQQEHPALFRLEGTQIFFASSITTTDAFRERGTVLMRSSEQSWAMSGDISLRIRDPREWQMTSDGGPFTLGVALTLPSAADGDDSDDAPRQPRVLVAGTSTMLRDEFLPPADRVEEAQLAGAMAFALNAIDWLAQDSDLIAIRAKTIEEPALDVPQNVTAATEEAIAAHDSGDDATAAEALERRQAALTAWDSRKAMYRWGNTLLIPLAFAAFGVARWQMRQRRRANLKL